MRTIPILLLSVLLTACATVSTGDPLVVRAEQAETVGKSTLDMIVKADNANRDFYRTNAPAFHAFAEYLRAPVLLNNVLLPRGLSFVQALDNTKLAYKAGRAGSNDLITALSVLETATTQAQTLISQQQPQTK